jgi:hypothetical protein
MGSWKAWCAAGAVALVACVGRRDAADLAVGVEPFEQLRGMDVEALRSGMVRALRKNAAPAPFEGLRETIGEYDVLYSLTGFDGSDGSWPNEEALVLAIEASREWPSDSAALAGWRLAIRQLRAGLGVEPTCASITGPGFHVRIAQWEQGGGWSVSTTYAAADTSNASVLTPRHSIALRRQALTEQLPQGEAPDSAGTPAWTPASCSASDARAADANDTTNRATP